jgi:hypothetical protein
MARSSSVDPTSCFHSRYLTLYEVLSWITRREPQVKGARLTFADAVVEGKVPPRSKTVAALCQLHAALEQGHLRATGLRCAKASPKLLPAHYWPRLVFYNRAFGECRYHSLYKLLAPWSLSALTIIQRRQLREDSQVDRLKRPKPCAFRSETCAGSRTNLTKEFWSDLLFRADEVLAVWSPEAHANISVPATGDTLDREQQRRQRKLRQAPEAAIDKHITAVYDRAQNEGEKPPNVKELVPLVQQSLGNAGFKASGRSIIALAGDPKHEQRRRSPGKTVASEKRRKQR